MQTLTKETGATMFILDPCWVQQTWEWDIMRDTEGYHMMREQSIHQENSDAECVYAEKRASKHMKLETIKLKGEREIQLRIPTLQF